MRSSLAFVGIALLAVAVTACGRAGNKSRTSQDATHGVQTSHSSFPPSTLGKASLTQAEAVSIAKRSNTTSTRHYLNDGDGDLVGDGEKDNDHDIDKDPYLDYARDENGDYHDSDDSELLIWGRPANATDARAVTVAVEHYYAAASAHDGASACGQLLPSIARAVPLDFGRFGPSYLHGATTCRKVMDRLFARHRAQFRDPIHVTNVRMRGDFALAVIGSTSMPASVIAVTHASGTWRMNAILGAPLA